MGEVECGSKARGQLREEGRAGEGRAGEGRGEEGRGGEGGTPPVERGSGGEERGVHMAPRALTGAMCDCR